MSSKSIRFVSACAALALDRRLPQRAAAARARCARGSRARCGRRTRRRERRPRRRVRQGERPAARRLAGRRGEGRGTRGEAAVPAAPVPERAAQQYAQALNLMKAGRNTDAELEFKQLALAYPDYAGPEVNLGLLYSAGFALRRRGGSLQRGAGAKSGQRRRQRRARHRRAQARKIHRRPRRLTSVPSRVEPDYAPAYLNLGVLYDLVSRASRRRRSSNSSITSRSRATTNKSPDG